MGEFSSGCLGRDSRLTTSAVASRRGPSSASSCSASLRTMPSNFDLARIST